MVIGRAYVMQVQIIANLHTFGAKVAKSCKNLPKVAKNWQRLSKVAKSCQTWLYLAPLGSTGLHLASLGPSWLFWSTGHHWGPLIHFFQLWMIVMMFLPHPMLRREGLMRRWQHASTPAEGGRSGARYKLVQTVCAMLHSSISCSTFQWKHLRCM